MKKILYFYLILLSALSLNAVEFRVQNGFKEAVVLSFGAEDGQSLLGQKFTIPAGKSTVIRPKLTKDFIISDIYIDNGKPYRYGHKSFKGYSIEEKNRNKNLLIKLKTGTTIQFTATGPVKTEGPVFENVEVIK
jgi:hypothetical protein